MTKKEKTEITRSRIFAAAINEFGTVGYAAGSINNICKSGINKGLIYHNFKDKDELYLECVKRSCDDFIRYVIENQGEEGFEKCMKARRMFFLEHESEAGIFLEARTNSPQKLRNQIQKICESVDELNTKIFEKELAAHELRAGVTKEDALDYFLEIQKMYNFHFAKELKGGATPREQLILHERNLHKIFEFMLYGIAQRSNEI